MSKDYFLAALLVIIIFGLTGIIYEVFGYYVSGIKSPLSKFLYPTIYLILVSFFLTLTFR
jgi:hypothetical protein